MWLIMSISHLRVMPFLIILWLLSMKKVIEIDVLVLVNIADSVKSNHCKDETIMKS